MWCSLRLVISHNVGEIRDELIGHDITQLDNDRNESVQEHNDGHGGGTTQIRWQWQQRSARNECE